VLKCVSNDVEGVYGCAWADDQCVPRTTIECKNYTENVCRNYMANYCFWNVDECLSPLEVTDCAEIKNVTECVRLLRILVLLLVLGFGVLFWCFVLVFGFGCNEIKNSCFILVVS
jgi:hypothetical protein